MASPVIEWRSNTTPFGPLASQAFTGTGFGGAIPVGTTSGFVTVRVYNNFAGAGSIVDATNCVLAVYDDVIHQGQAITTPTTAQYTQVKVLSYNATTTGADSQYYGIGGAAKHAVPVNAGTLAGAASNYIALNIQIAVPTGATQGAVSQGIWLEYSSTS